MTPSTEVVDTWVSKSQCSSIPAISTTRRSCISPQAPRACGRRERPHEGVGLGLELLRRHRGQAHRLHQGGVRGDPGLVVVDDRLGHLAERLLDRRDELLHLGSLLGELAGLDLLAGLEPLVGEGEERLVVVPQRLSGEGLELLGHPLLLVTELGEALGRGGLLGLERGRDRGQLALGGTRSSRVPSAGRAAAVAEPDDGADGESDEEQHQGGEVHVLHDVRRHRQDRGAAPELVAGGRTPRRT